MHSVLEAFSRELADLVDLFLQLDQGFFKIQEGTSGHGAGRAVEGGATWVSGHHEGGGQLVMQSQGRESMTA